MRWRHPKRGRAPRTPTGPLILVTESLGSKMAFDALSELESKPVTNSSNVGKRAMGRLALVFMGANQIPMLGLGDQSIDPAVSSNECKPTAEPLQNLFDMKARSQAESGDLSRLKLIAFSDPNDLLTWRLQKTRYAAANVDIADVVVSNDTTYLGQIENPWTAHTTYLANLGVSRLIACGSPNETSGQKADWCR